MVHFPEMNPQFKRSNFHHTVTRSRETVAEVRTAVEAAGELDESVTVAGA
jgi:hypothetical protein